MKTALIPALAALLALPSVAAAADPKADLATLTQEVDRLEAADDGQVARAELNVLREELGATRAHLDQHHQRSARRVFERARLRTRLVAAMLGRARAEAEAREVAQAATARRDEADALRNRAFELEQTLVKLEQTTKTGGTP